MEDRHPLRPGVRRGLLPLHEREEDRAFAGLTSREHSTGETERRGKITGLGQGFIRSTLIENSWAAIRKDQALLAKFTRVWRNSGSKKKAIVAVARTLVIRLRACMVSGTPYATGIVR